jgi:hypothetical protein
LEDRQAKPRPQKFAIKSFLLSIYPNRSNLSCRMANSKSIAELPRFLLPRLTWASTPVKGTVSQLGPTHQRRAHLNPHRFSSTSPPRATSISLPSTARSHHSCADAATSPSRRRRPSTIPANAAPLRHNGVYVAAYRPARRAFSSTATTQKDHHFDTLKFVQRLKAEGFNEEQAVAMMRVLNDVIEESIQNLTRTMVLKEGMAAESQFQAVEK